MYKIIHHKIKPQTVLEVVHGFRPLSANPTKWSDTLEHFVGNLATNCLSVFDHFMGLVLNNLIVTLSAKFNILSDLNRSAFRTTVWMYKY